MIPRSTLEQWRALQAVIDHGGYSQAAEHLHRSQSSVSYNVAKLEEHLGVKLLEIIGRKAHLTEAGDALLKRSRQLTSDALELEQLASHLEQGWEAEINVVFDAAFPVQLLMAALKQFAPLSHRTRVVLKEAVLSGTDDALLDGSADLAIGARIPQGFLGNNLVEIEFLAVAHPDHPLHKLERTVTARDLSRETQVVIRDSGIRHPRDSGWLGSAQRWTVSSFETAITTISNGLGFGWIVRHRIADQLKTGDLKRLPLDAGQTRRAHLNLVFGRPDNTGPATRLLADILHEISADYQLTLTSDPA
ncbi:MAG: LysR family transcriptional regulator [Gammaproteobacteria bacterium]